MSTGLGEIYQFVVQSDQHSPMQLRTILDWEIVPKLRTVPGVIEVNTMGGDLKQYQVVVDPQRLHAHELTLNDVARRARARQRQRRRRLPRAQRRVVHDPRAGDCSRATKEIANVVVRVRDGQPPVLVRHIAQVQGRRRARATASSRATARARPSPASS